MILAREPRSTIRFGGGGNDYLQYAPYRACQSNNDSDLHVCLNTSHWDSLCPTGLSPWSTLKKTLADGVARSAPREMRLYNANGISDWFERVNMCIYTVLRTDSALTRSVACYHRAHRTSNLLKLRVPWAGPA